MTEEERNYMFFKVHDLDGNDKLDGLEIFYSATHHSAHEHDHNHEHNEHSGNNEEKDVNENENDQPSHDNSSDVSNLKLLELDENGQIVNKNFNHIIGWYFTNSFIKLIISLYLMNILSILRCVRQFSEFGRS